MIAQMHSCAGIFILLIAHLVVVIVVGTEGTASTTSTTTGRQFALGSRRMGFIGLGAMGVHMAKHLQTKICDSKSPLMVWNRTPERAQEHSTKFSTESTSELSAFNECSIIFLSLPTSNEVKDILDRCPLQKGTIVIDTTSGVPSATKVIADSCRANGVTYIDCPVSGGPAGAEAGTLTTMIGGDDITTVEEVVIPLVTQSISRKAVYCGPSGSGMAVKSINNIMNTAHVCIAAEGLLALRNFGVEPDIALDVINSSSGRSLATQERVPQEVLTGRYGFGFKLPLMAKDCRIASSLMSEYFPGATLLPEVSNLMETAEATEWGKSGDYTEVVKILEERAGKKLQN